MDYLIFGLWLINSSNGKLMTDRFSSKAVIQSILVLKKYIFILENTVGTNVKCILNNNIVLL